MDSPDESWHQPRGFLPLSGCNAALVYIASNARKEIKILEQKQRLAAKAIPVHFGLLIVAAIAAVFVYPKGFGAKWQPWRLGLDLVGGSHLVYNVDLSKVTTDDRGSVLNGLRDVIERRVREKCGLVVPANGGNGESAA